MTYHFRVHRQMDLLWAECVELEGCATQGKNRGELAGNMKEALNLFLDEPESSKVIFPFASGKALGRNVVPVEVEPSVAFSMQLRQLRIQRRMTQKQAARLLGMRNLYSYQRLERRPNPSLSTMKKIKNIFPGFSFDTVLGP